MRCIWGLKEKAKLPRDLKFGPGWSPQPTAGSRKPSEWVILSAAGQTHRPLCPRRSHRTGRAKPYSVLGFSTIDWMFLMKPFPSFLDSRHHSTIATRGLNRGALLVGQAQLSIEDSHVWRFLAKAGVGFLTRVPACAIQQRKASALQRSGEQNRPPNVTLVTGHHRLQLTSLCQPLSHS